MIKYCLNRDGGEWNACMVGVFGLHCRVGKENNKACSLHLRLDVLVRMAERIKMREI